MRRSAVAEILGVPEAEAERIEADALEYFRDCFHIDRVNAFYELRPEAEKQKELARKSHESRFDNFAGTHVDMLLAQYDEEKDYHFDVSYRDFCLAVANGCVEALQEHGFFGWSLSSYGQEMVNLRHVIFLKAIGLGREKELMERDVTEERRGPKSNFEKEMEILFA